jgi:hypothetical protein
VVVRADRGRRPRHPSGHGRGTVLCARYCLRTARTRSLPTCRRSRWYSPIGSPCRFGAGPGVCLSSRTAGTPSLPWDLVGGAQSSVPGMIADREDAFPPLPAPPHPRRMIAVLGDRLALCPARDLRTVVLMVLSRRPFASKKPTPIRAVSLCPLCVHGLSRSISTPRFPGGLLCFVVRGFTRRAGLRSGAILQNGCAAGIGRSLLTRTCDCGGDRFRMRGYHAAALAAGWVGLNL